MTGQTQYWPRLGRGSPPLNHRGAARATQTEPRSPVTSPGSLSQPTSAAPNIRHRPPCGLLKKAFSTHTPNFSGFCTDFVSPKCNLKQSN